MGKRKQRSKQIALDSFPQERAEPTCKAIAKLGWCADQLFARRTLSVYAADENSQKTELRFFANSPCPQTHARLLPLEITGLFITMRESVAGRQDVADYYCCRQNVHVSHTSLQIIEIQFFVKKLNPSSLQTGPAHMHSSGLFV